MELSSRYSLMLSWLEALFPEQALHCAVVAGDASFRRYFRISSELALWGNASLIVMDAPPEHEDCSSFVLVSDSLDRGGIVVPRVLASNFEQGFLLLSDLGPTTLWQALQHQPAEPLYHEALRTLIKLQGLNIEPVPRYTSEHLIREMRLFTEWYLPLHLKFFTRQRETDLCEAVFSRIAEQVMAQPQVLVHRDYHSRNLMWQRAHIGVLDFQDALLGPPSYDLISLVRDAYIGWDQAFEDQLFHQYWLWASAAGLKLAPWSQWRLELEWVALQRALKVLGIFARLYHRDNKAGYVADMPLVRRHLSRALSALKGDALLAEFCDVVEALP